MWSTVDLRSALQGAFLFYTRRKDTKMKKLLIFLFALAVALSFTACNQKFGSGNSNSSKKVPVYQGMTVGSSPKMSASLDVVNGNGNTNSNKNEDNGNHYGHYKGDHTGQEEGGINQINPYPDNSKDETIEEEAKDSLEVIGAAQEIYYANQNSYTYIYIHIDNPDSFEILSFTLNGKKYTSYMFEQGSNLETIIIKYDVGNAHGIVDYTIDAIKYVDGEEIKDVIIAGDKTVKVGVRVNNQVTATVSNVAIGTNSLSFDVNASDNDGLIAFSNGTLKAVIYDGETIVAMKDVALGDNSIIFDGLKSHGLYQYAIIGFWDDLSGFGPRVNLLYKNAFYTERIVLFDNIEVGKNNIEFGFNWFEERPNKEITALKLYLDETLVKELDKNATEATELLSGRTYKLVAEYLNGNKTESISIKFTTYEMILPAIAFSYPSTTQTSIRVTPRENDEDNVGSITKVELIDANGTLVAESVDEINFENLLSGNSYTVRITYTYNLNDGMGEKTLVKELTAKTDAMAFPSFVVKNENITFNSFTADYDIVDADNVISSYTSELYSNEVLIVENGTNPINFSSLSYGNDYAIRFTYTFDLNDGNGEQTAVYNYDFKTYVDVIGCRIKNTDAVSIGGTIFMDIDVYNPFGMMVESIVINGVTYYATGSLMAKTLSVEIVCKESFGGGYTNFNVDQLNTSLGGNTYTVEPKTNCSANVFINGKIEILSVQIVDENFEKITKKEWAFPNEKVYVLITVNNPTGYTIGSFEDYNKLDENRYYYAYNLVGGKKNNIYVSISEIEYHNEYISARKDVEINSNYVSFYVVKSNEIKYVSTPNDLQNMSDGYYYELQNDIDLSGFMWRGKTFNGIFDGKGHSIKNMRFVGTVTEYTAVGLFSTGTGFIWNLNMEGVKIDVSSESAGITIGAIVAKTPYNEPIHINNCYVDANSVIKATSQTGTVIVGGLIGAIVAETSGSSHSDVKNSTNCADISGGKAGGLIGQTTNYVEIENCINKGDIVGTTAGFFVGYKTCNRGNGVVILNSINFGTVKSGGNVVHKWLGAYLGSYAVFNSLDMTEFEDYNGEVHTYTFITGDGIIIESITSDLAINLPRPQNNDGYYFLDWYDNANLSGSPVKSPYYSSTVQTLYAKWVTAEEWFLTYGGVSQEKAFELTEGEAIYVGAKGGQTNMIRTLYFTFTATESKTYTFQSLGDYDTRAELKNEKMGYIGFDVGGEKENFLMRVNLTAGQTVYLEVDYLQHKTAGQFAVLVN